MERILRRSSCGAALLLGLLVAGASAAFVGPPKKSWESIAGDTPRERVEMIQGAPQQYVIHFGGALDGTMTRMPVGYAAFVQGWQPNRSVLIENVGQTVVRNPRITVNGKRRWATMAEVIADAARGYNSPGDRARAIWEFRRRSRFHATTWDPECSDAIKALCVYGYTLCGDEALVLNDLWKAAGLQTRRGYPVGHCVTEVYFDGSFHLLDSDEHVICLRRDNRTIASEAEIVRDHDLVKRTHTYGIGCTESRETDEFSASLYGYEGERQGDWGDSTRHAMELVLRPGESIEYRWDHVGKQYTAGELTPAGRPIRDGQGDLLAGWGTVAYDNLVNGRLCYRPDLAGPGAETIENVRFDKAAFRPENAAKPAAVVWRFAGPYVFVGGNASASLRLGKGASASWEFSADGKTWTNLGTTTAAGDRPLVAELDSRLSPRGRPTYQFWLKLVLTGDATAARPAFQYDVQMALLALPELEVGRNQIEYTDASTGGRTVRVRHRWIERGAWPPPHAPAEPLDPKDGQVVQGSLVQFRWKPASHPQGQAIADYHFELSEHADMRWPLSPNFERLTSLTPSGGQPQWAVPYPGLLNPGTAYYWRVRACDVRGVWGPWSRTFSFRLRCPGVPLDVRLVPRGEHGLVLCWTASTAGEPPVAYKVYGSDERGFTASDQEYLVNRGKGFVRSVEAFNAIPANAHGTGMAKTPSNLISRVTGRSLPVVGAALTMPNTNKAYYRVVAIDSSGSESGPSDYAEVPRPFLVHPPEIAAHAGKPFRCELRVIRSDGDLRCRPTPESSYNAAYWDREDHRFHAVGLPEGLSIDEEKGTIAGVPNKAGVFSVALRIENKQGKIKEFPTKLRVDAPLSANNPKTTEKPRARAGLP